MRRALAILKWFPAVVCGLLVVAWVVSTIFATGMFVPHLGGVTELQLDGGALAVTHYYPGVEGEFVFGTGDPRPDTVMGVLAFGTDNTLAPCLYAFVPVAVVITLLLPFAVGCLSRFRFPLWSYFVWTALVAAELAFYLR
jgi:hypothetical protein